MDEKLGLTEMAEEYLKDSRHGQNIQHAMTGLLRQSVYSRLGGYEDTNDAEGLRKDPGVRAVIGERALEKAGAGETTIGRFEKEILQEGNNLSKMDELIISRPSRYGGQRNHSGGGSPDAQPWRRRREFFQRHYAALHAA
jgi:hypothetical protein